MTNDVVEEVKSVGKTLWWLLVLRGAVTIVFGVMALVWPHHTVAALLWVFAIFSIVEGVIEVLVGVFARRTHWGWTVFSGLLGIALGVVILRHPGAALWVLVTFIAAWALVTGMFMIFGAYSMTQADTQGSKLWTLVSGVINVLFGVVMFVNPVGGARALWLWVGIYAVILGAAMIATAFAARREIRALMA